MATPAPDVPERSEALTFAIEDTDFDRWEWNYAYDHRDPSGATWGPAGLTVLHNEVQQVFRKIDDESPGLLKSIFGPQYSVVRHLEAKNGREAKRYLQQKIYRGRKREEWTRNVRELARYEIARRIYLDYSRRVVAEKMRVLHDAFPIETALDYAFYWDLSVHTGGLTPRRRRIAEQLFQQERPDTPARRRQLIGQVFVDTLGNRSQVRVRTQRNALFVRGSAAVHGTRMDCAVYGLDDRPLSSAARAYFSSSSSQGKKV